MRGHYQPQAGGLRRRGRRARLPLREAARAPRHDRALPRLSRFRCGGLRPRPPRGAHRRAEGIGNPLVRAEAELRAELYKGHPYSIPPRGTASSLAAATREGIARYWSRGFSADRLSIVAVADLEPSELARLLAEPLGAIPSDSARPAKPAPIPIRPWFKAVAVAAMPGSAILHGEYEAPEASSPDYPALSLALLMLDDLLLEGLRGNEGLAYGAWTKLSAAAAPSASITIYKTGNPAAAKTAVDEAIAELASSRASTRARNSDNPAPLPPKAQRGARPSRLLRGASRPTRLAPSRSRTLGAPAPKAWRPGSPATSRPEATVRRFSGWLSGSAASAPTTSPGPRGAGSRMGRPRGSPSAIRSSCSASPRRPSRPRADRAACGRAGAAILIVLFDRRDRGQRAERLDRSLNVIPRLELHREGSAQGAVAALPEAALAEPP